MRQQSGQSIDRIELNLLGLTSCVPFFIVYGAVCDYSIAFPRSGVCVNYNVNGIAKNGVCCFAGVKIIDAAAHPQSNTGFAFEGFKP